MASLLEQARIARQCIPEKGPVLVNHSGKAGEFVSARAFFETAGCPQGFIELLLQEGEDWVYEAPEYSREVTDLGREHYVESVIYPAQVGDESIKDSDLGEGDKATWSIYSAPVEEVDTYLKSVCSQIYEGANGSLDAIFTYGFNRHDLTHIEWVKNETIQRLREGGYGEDVVRRGVMAAWDHDSGNVLSRNVHSFISPRILQRTIPSLTEDSSQWRIVRRAIQMHNEPVATKMTEYVKSQCKTDNPEEFYTNMLEVFQPEGLGLIIADKTHVGRERVSFKAQSKEAVNGDPHLEVNLLGETTNVGLSTDKRTFMWELSFTPGIDKDLEKKHLHALARQRGSDGSLRAFVSEETHDKHRQALPIPHFDTWKARFWNLYLDRVILTARSTFALYPECQEFTVKMVDADGVGDDADFKEETTFTIQRYGVDVAEKWLRTKFVKKEARK